MVLAIPFPESRNSQLPRPPKPPNKKETVPRAREALQHSPPHDVGLCGTCISTVGKAGTAGQPSGIHHFGEECACTGLLQVSVPSSLGLSSPFADSDSSFPLCPTLGRLNKPLAQRLLCLQPFLFAFTFLEHE